MNKDKLIDETPETPSKRKTVAATTTNKATLYDVTQASLFDALESSLLNTDFQENILDNKSWNSLIKNVDLMPTNEKNALAVHPAGVMVFCIYRLIQAFPCRFPDYMAREKGYEPTYQYYGVSAEDWTRGLAICSHLKYTLRKDQFGNRKPTTRSKASALYWGNVLKQPQKHNKNEESNDGIDSGEDLQVESVIANATGDRVREALKPKTSSNQDGSKSKPGRKRAMAETRAAYAHHEHITTAIVTSACYRLRSRGRFPLKLGDIGPREHYRFFKYLEERIEKHMTVEPEGELLVFDDVIKEINQSIKDCDLANELERTGRDEMALVDSGTIPMRPPVTDLDEVDPDGDDETINSELQQYEKDSKTMTVLNAIVSVIKNDKQAEFVDTMKKFDLDLEHYYNTGKIILDPKHHPEFSLLVGQVIGKFLSQPSALS